jgi:hypothetical protein
VAAVRHLTRPAYILRDVTPPDLEPERRLGRLFVLIVAIEAATIAALYAFGLHFR